MKFTQLILLFSLTVFQGFAQAPSFNFTKSEVEANLKYIASDELGGRRTGSVGEQKAAQFIAKSLRDYGVRTAPGYENYFQNVPFANILPPTSGEFVIGKESFKIGDNLLIINGKDIDKSLEVVFAGNGWVDETSGLDDYKGLDVKGKIVVVVTGLPDANSPMDVFNSMKRKQELAAERGALALIETYKIALPWPFALNYFGKERMELSKPADPNNSIVYGWALEKTPGTLSPNLNSSKTTAQLKIKAGPVQQIQASNVIGIIEGTDENLRNEYILLSAHHDHVGIGKQGGAAFTPQDSIFNGARDNGIGTVALMAAAKHLAANPPKRSVLILACTAEEMGMLGSSWYAENPAVPLENTVFNLNTDGAGYNSTAHFNVIGKGLTNVDDELEAAGKAAGLAMLGDPAPEQNLYERSDNISFAAKGIPAVDFAPGITEMGEEVFKYYHQAADNADSINYDYLLKFCEAYTLAALKIANKTGKIEWTKEGEKYRK
ncbi:MAG: M28 family peptidase [Saprospiraceae bacterium]|nr:M28 family peptidase [Saprospiraceae bacterium]